MRMLPQDLLSNAESSQFASHVSEGVSSPEVWSQKGHGISVPPMQLQDPDDRWVAIPSGIVDGRKAELEATELPLGGRVRDSGEGADEEIARQTSSEDEEPL